MTCTEPHARDTTHDERRRQRSGAGAAVRLHLPTPSWAGLSKRAKERRGTAARVDRGWKPALDLLDQVLSVAEEFGLIHVERLVAAPERARGMHPLLLDLHSRGVQVAEETLALMRSGFAAGAEARWRTLHETAVVAAFLVKHGEETATRYMEHDHVRIKRAMDLEQEHHVALGLEPYTQPRWKRRRRATTS